MTPSDGIEGFCESHSTAITAVQIDGVEGEVRGICEAEAQNKANTTIWSRPNKRYSTTSSVIGSLTAIIILEESHKLHMGMIRRKRRQHDVVLGGFDGVLGCCVVCGAISLDFDACALGCALSLKGKWYNSVSMWNEKGRSIWACCC